MNPHVYVRDLFADNLVLRQTNNNDASEPGQNTLVVSDGTIPATVAGDLYLIPYGSTPIDLSHPTIAGGNLIDNQTFIVDATDPTKRLGFDINGSPGTTTSIITNSTVNRSIGLGDIDGTVLVQNPSEFVFIGQPGVFQGSNAGIQHSSLVATRPSYRSNQYGNNTGIPGATGFKSRSTSLGGLAPVQVGDSIYGITAIGVTDNLSIPLSGLLRCEVSSVPAGQGWIGTQWTFRNVSNNGPSNGQRNVFQIDSEGILRLRETAAWAGTYPASGVVLLSGAGAATVANGVIPSNARVMTTVQPGQAPAGMIWCSSIISNTSFTITSTAGATDNGVSVYYQIYAPLL
jgi:hypothetical protein